MEESGKIYEAEVRVLRSRELDLQDIIGEPLFRVIGAIRIHREAHKAIDLAIRSAFVGFNRSPLLSYLTQNLRKRTWAEVPHLGIETLQGGFMLIACVWCWEYSDLCRRVSRTPKDDLSRESCA